MTTPQPSGGQVRWHVKSQNLTTTISDSGTGFESVWEVRYQVDSGPANGTVSMVRIPAAQYNADNVRNAINAQVYHVHSVASL